MQVKCPKCRLRYETNIPFGMTEVSCVCPRCGTPFTHLVDSQQEEDSVGEFDRTERVYNQQTPTDSPKGGALDNGETSSDTPADRTSTTSHSSSSEILDWQKPNASTASKPSRPSFVTGKATPTQQQKQQGHFYTSCTFIFFVVLIMVVFSIRSCWKSAKTHEYNGASLSETTMGVPSQDDNLTAVQDESVDPYDEIHPGKAPSWIQGNWKFTTEYGDILLSIHGNKITESIDGEKSSGTFYYENRKLVCDFGDPNNIMIYRLDVERQQIDAGNGMLMTKE